MTIINRVMFCFDIDAGPFPYGPSKLNPPAVALQLFLHAAKAIVRSAALRGRDRDIKWQSGGIYVTTEIQHGRSDRSRRSCRMHCA